MKTAGRENPNHGVASPRNRAHGAEEQNRSRSIKWAEKQEKFQPKEMCLFLTSTFIELPGTYPPTALFTFCLPSNDQRMSALFIAVVFP
jgi:hypothetical protein